MGICELQFKGRIDKNFICSVCREVFENAVRTPCGHVFCMDCVGEWLDFGNSNCPDCRKPLHHSSLQSDCLVNGVIGNLEVLCPNSKAMQQANGSTENLGGKKEGEGEAGCSADIDKAHHSAEEMCCSWKGRYADLEAHVQVCPFEKVRCDHFQFTCPWKGLRSGLVEHLGQCPYERVRDFLYKQKEKVVQANKKVEEMENKTVHLETVLRSKTDEWLKVLQVGEKIDALDKFGKWYEATVIALAPSVVTVHYDGWKRDYDERLPRSSTRIAPLHLHTLKRRKRKRASRRFRDFEEGDVIDCKDTMGDWYESTIVEANEDQVLVHYENWSNIWDEWISRSSDRLAPLRTHSGGHFVQGNPNAQYNRHHHFPHSHSPRGNIFSTTFGFNVSQQR